MRRFLVVGVVVASLGGLIGSAGPLGLAGSAGAAVPAAKRPPVTLKGKVNNQGTKTITGTAITIEQDDDLYFKPTFIKGAPGTTVSVTIKNSGRMQHTFTLTSQTIDQLVNAGKSVTVQVTIPADGTPAPFYCRFHRRSGMQGAFFSTPGKKA